MPNALPEDERATIRDFHHWIIVARRMVHDSFTVDEKELQRLTLEAAQGLMLDHRLGGIERKLGALTGALQNEG